VPDGTPSAPTLARGGANAGSRDPGREGQHDVLRSQIAQGVAAEERGELRDGEQAIADVRRRIAERLRRGE
jgi:hypothetical protein